MVSARGFTRRSQRLGAPEALHDRQAGSSERADTLQDLPDVVRPKRTFRFLGISDPVGYGLLKSGELRGIRIGVTWRISKHEIRRFLRLD
jgi:excisionase family DNA binding protein